jgi:ribose transport system permease protein
MNDVQVVQPGSAASGAGSRLLSRDRLLQFGVLWALVIVLIGAAIVYPRVFEPRNVQNILSQAAPVGIVSVGMTFVMIGGGFDLSVGSTLALGAVVFAHLADPLGLWGAAAAVLLASIVCGVINGLIVTKLRVNPFVATLGTGSVFGGYAFIYSNSAPQVPNDFNFQYIGTESWFGWPISIYILIVIFLFGAFALARTVYGRSIYALGGNNEAARLSGIPVDFLRASTYVMTAICSGIGGIILSSRLGVGQADMGGARFDRHRRHRGHLPARRRGRDVANGGGASHHRHAYQCLRCTGRQQQLPARGKRHDRDRRGGARHLRPTDARLKGAAAMIALATDKRRIPNEK